MSANRLLVATLLLAKHGNAASGGAFRSRSYPGFREMQSGSSGAACALRRSLGVPAGDPRGPPRCCLLGRFGLLVLLALTGAITRQALI